MNNERGAWIARLDRMRRTAQRNARTAGITDNVRSGLELQVSIFLKHHKISYEFEAEVIPYVSEPERHKYTPDFKITTRTGKVLYIETKGRMELADRKKHLWIKKQHPHLDIRFVFSKPNSWDRAAKTRSYGKWATDHGFKWCGKSQFPLKIKEWANE